VSSHVRWALHSRDHGVCAVCGQDAEEFLQFLRLECERIAAEREKQLGFAVWSGYSYSRLGTWWRDECARRGLGRLDPGQSLWCADHIEPLADAGKPEGLDGYQTLCLWCHKAKTAREAAERAAKRREQRAAETHAAVGQTSLLKG
jgi:hypothetical protein